MAQRFNSQSFFVRFLFALLLVFVSYNPSGYSYYHWAQDAFFGQGTFKTPPFAMTTVLLMIGERRFVR